MHRLGTIACSCWAGIALFGGSAFAAGIQPGTPTCDDVVIQSETNYSLGVFVRMPTQGCSVGPFTISGFTFTSSSSDPQFPGAQLGDLSLFPTWVGNVLTLDLQGFNCPGCNSGPNSTIDYTFGFTVDPAPIVDSEEVTLDPPFGTITGIQDFTACTSTTRDCNTGRGFFFIGQPLRVDFSPPVYLVTAFNTISLGNNSGFDGVLFRFHTTVPEPGTWLLLGSGLAAAALFRRRRSA